MFLFDIQDLPFKLLIVPLFVSLFSLGNLRFELLYLVIQFQCLHVEHLGILQTLFGV